MSQATGPLVLLLVVLAVDAAIYLDAERHEAAGEAVTFRVGALTVETPSAWLIACLVLFVAAVPAYLVARST